MPHRRPLAAAPSALRKAPLPLTTTAGAVRGDAAPTWLRWYRLDRWQRLRAEVLLDALYTCAMCGQMHGNTSDLVADHIRPHRGDPALFWDRANLQCLCHECHASAKQREERKA